MFTQFQILSALLEQQNAKISELMNENKQLVSSFNAELHKLNEDFAMLKDSSTSKLRNLQSFLNQSWYVILV